MNSPLIALTMGDPAGVGPEVIVKAATHSAFAQGGRPVVIGDQDRLIEATRICSLDIPVVSIDKPSEYSGPERLHVIQVGRVDSSLPFGAVSVDGGAAAYRYVATAADLAMRGEVEAICTAPLNKEALHLAGYIYPGHTELLAHLTGVSEVSMMLMSERLKVIHVTTHVGLIDAVALIEPGLVYRTIVRGNSTLVQAGVTRPRIAVCGINPHAGENGIFGYGEDESKVRPGVDEARAEGIDAKGPLPADTVFYRAARGDFDLVVAMYHDQGHGPVKVGGLEYGVNVTIGLPVVRTSVDHGTAFDIAGTGRAEEASLLEALRQAAVLADHGEHPARR